jgi:subtilisin family serine protease/outer membrane protein OmpA-like peptidoglycan-associated protein
MDPALWELLRAEAGTDGDRELEAIIRLARPGIDIPDVRIVSRFGPIVTCRIRARDVIAVRARPDVISIKAARGLSPGFEPATPALPSTYATAARRSPGLALTGAGVAVACVDWGVDVDSASFRWPDDPAAADGDHRAGATRLLSLWDQRDQAVGPRPEPYGYGAVHEREEIDRALQSTRPYEYLGYHPAIADPKGTGSHGTRTMDIAAGNGQAGGPAGIAPDADLIFVHLADRNTGGLANFGDSVRLLEAVDFISRTAGPQPCVINISAGRICGPKDGTTLVERAFDELLAATPGRFVANSAGNYAQWRAHSCGTLAPGESRTFTLVSNPADITVNELEIWYDGADEFAVRIDPPGYVGGRPVRLGERSDLLIGGRVVGRIYHRKHDPNNGDNHIVAFLDPIGRAGQWAITLEARRVSSGRFHAWIERDDSCPGCQARFARNDSSPAITIGSIASSHLPLIVGAYDGHDPARPVAAFSSAGPCRDGRSKPDLAAPGVGVLAARSAPVGASRNPGLLVWGDGTSFATPHVTGAVALCFEAAGSQLSAQEIRSLVLGSCDPPLDADSEDRLGRGYLNIPRLVADVQRALAPADALIAKEPTMDAEDTVVLLAAAPATAYREYLYRPHGRLARWMGDWFEVVAKPGQGIRRAAQEGDVLIEVSLGRISPGRCVTLTARDLERVASWPMLAPGRLLLRPRRRTGVSEPLPVEPVIDTGGRDTGIGGDSGDDGAEPGSADTADTASVPDRSEEDAPDYLIRATPESESFAALGIEAAESEGAEAQRQEQCAKTWKALRDSLPEEMTKALGAGQWIDAARWGIQHGIRDVDHLTDIIFWQWFGDSRGYCKLTPSEPKYAYYADQWEQIREQHVRPAFTFNRPPERAGPTARVAHDKRLASAEPDNPPLDITGRYEDQRATPRFTLRVNQAGRHVECLLTEAVLPDPNPRIRRGQRRQVRFSGDLKSPGSKPYFELYERERPSVPVLLSAEPATGAVRIWEPGPKDSPAKLFTAKLLARTPTLLETALSGLGENDIVRLYEQRPLTRHQINHLHRKLQPGALTPFLQKFFDVGGDSTPDKRMRYESHRPLVEYLEAVWNDPAHGIEEQDRELAKFYARTILTLGKSTLSGYLTSLLDLLQLVVARLTIDNKNTPPTSDFALTRLLGLTAPPPGSGGGHTYKITLTLSGGGLFIAGYGGDITVEKTSDGGAWKKGKKERFGVLLAGMEAGGGIKPFSTIEGEATVPYEWQPPEFPGTIEIGKAEVGAYGVSAGGGFVHIHGRGHLPLMPVIFADLAPNISLEPKTLEPDLKLELGPAGYLGKILDRPFPKIDYTTFTIKTDYAVIYNLTRQAHFPLDSATLSAEARQAIRVMCANELAAFGSSSSHLTITGHTDPIGGPKYNRELSDLRAKNALQAVKDVLGSRFEIPEANICACGKGEELATKEEPGKEVNPRYRRVDIILNGRLVLTLSAQ